MNNNELNHKTAMNINTQLQATALAITQLTEGITECNLQTETQLSNIDHREFQAIFKNNK